MIDSGSHTQLGQPTHTAQRINSCYCPYCTAGPGFLFTPKDTHLAGCGGALPFHTQTHTPGWLWWCFIVGCLFGYAWRSAHNHRYCGCLFSFGHGHGHHHHQLASSVISHHRLSSTDSNSNNSTSVSALYTASGKRAAAHQLTAISCFSARHSLAVLSSSPVVRHTPIAQQHSTAHHTPHTLLASSKHTHQKQHSHR